MHYVILLEEDMCKGVQSERFNISIEDICNSQNEAKSRLGNLYRKLQQDDIYSVCEYKDSSFHLENLDIDKYSYTGFIIEFPTVKSSGFIKQHTNPVICKQTKITS